jgi:hypothetical protein
MHSLPSARVVKTHWGTSFGDRVSGSFAALNYFAHKLAAHRMLSCSRSCRKEHLQDRPYHISALFVVDLAAFRR